jgi:hypothetical protein
VIWISLPRGNPVFHLVQYLESMTLILVLACPITSQNVIGTPKESNNEKKDEWKDTQIDDYRFSLCRNNVSCFGDI